MPFVSRMEGQTSVDVTEEDDAIEMPETNVRCQSVSIIYYVWTLS